MSIKIFCGVAFLVAYVNADCTSGVNSCTQVFEKSVSEATQPLTTSFVCSAVEQYVHCIFNQGCDTRYITEQDILNFMNYYLKMYGLSCPFTASSIYSKYRNGVSSNQPMTFTLLLIMAATAVTLKQIFIHG